MNPIFAAAMRRRFAGAGGLESALANLSQSLTINGVTKTPGLLIYGSDITAALATATYGDNMSIAGAGTDPVVDQETPLISTTDKAARWGAGSKYHLAPDNDNWSFGTDDVVIEAVAQVGNTGGGEIIIGKLSGADRCELQTTASQLRLSWSVGGVGSKTVSAGVAGTPKSWVHAIFFLDRSGSSLAYANAVPDTAATDISAYAASTMTVASQCSLGSRKGVADYTESLAYLATWQGAAWLDTHDQQAIATARFKALCGANTDETRDSLAYLHKPVSGSKKYFLVGKNWMRLSQDVGGSPAYQKEAAATNAQDHDGFDLTAAGGWTLGGITATADDADTPIAGALGTKLVEDGSLGTHTTYNSLNQVTVYQGMNTHSIIAIPNGRSFLWIRMYNGSANNLGAYFNLSGNGSVVSEFVGANWTGGSAAIEALGGGAYRLSTSGTYTPVSANLRCYYYMMSDASTFNYTGTLGLHGMTLIASQVEAGALSSIVKTANGANETRLADA